VSAARTSWPSNAVVATYCSFSTLMSRTDSSSGLSKSTAIIVARLPNRNSPSLAILISSVLGDDRADEAITVRATASFSVAGGSIAAALTVALVEAVAEWWPRAPVLVSRVASMPAAPPAVAPARLPGRHIFF
jgi:hypothetical protein